MKIFIDLHGVLVNFIEPFAERWSMKYDMKSHPLGVYDLHQVFNVTPCQIDYCMDGLSIEFWENLPKEPDADRLVKAAFSMTDNVWILTQWIDGNCAEGTHKLVKKLFPLLEDRIVITKCKYALASPSNILIDDWDKNIDDFEANDGIGILYPRPWNKSYFKCETEMKAPNVIYSVLSELSLKFGGISSDR